MKGAKYTKTGDSAVTLQPELSHNGSMDSWTDIVGIQKKGPQRESQNLVGYIANCVKSQNIFEKNNKPVSFKIRHLYQQTDFGCI